MITHLEYNPDEMLERAIAAWMRHDGAPMPSRVDSSVDLDADEVTLANVNGELARYSIIGGRLRRRKDCMQ